MIKRPLPFTAILALSFSITAVQAKKKTDPEMKQLTIDDSNASYKGIRKLAEGLGV